jgi:hypothetical protein
MKSNVGTTERLVRIGLGVILLLTGYFAALPQWGSIIAYLLGVVAIVTGAVSFCPLWQLLGINTCESGPPRKA